MIAQKGPLTPEQPGMPQGAPPSNPEHHFLSNPEVAHALTNPETVHVSNPEVVKAFAFSPPKRGRGSNPTPPAVTQAPLTFQSGVTRGPDIAYSPSVFPEQNKLPSGLSIFPVVPTTGARGPPGPSPTATTMQGPVM